MAGYGETGGLTSGMADNYNETMGAFGAKSVRLAFIRKVYGILSAQLVITFGFVLIFVFHDGTKDWAKTNPGFIFAAIIMSMASLIALMCCGDLRKRFPHNFIILGIFTLAQSLSLGLVTAHYRTNIVVMAIGITAFVCITLTIFAMQTKIDFTLMAGAAFVALMVLMMVGLILMFFPKIPFLRVIYSGVGALLFSLFLLIDTQMIMGGRKEEITPEEYILAVMMLYMDIINLFLHILQLLNSSN
ncbi:Protein lifeguard 2 [Halotydeus destructor]|nr:Protein lifeguard 2 [Halotydeus destructor]